MRKIFLLMMLFASLFSFSQSAVNKQLALNVERVHSAKTIAELETSFQNFSELTKKLDKKTHWLAYYYAGFSAYKQAMMLKKQNPTTDVNSLLGLAYKNAASALYNKENAETHALVGHISVAIVENGKGNFFTEADKMIQNHLSEAEAFDAKNLRVILLKAKIQILYPDDFKGDKNDIKSSLTSFSKQKKTVIQKNMPIWGKEEIQDVLSKF